MVEPWYCTYESLSNQVVRVEPVEMSMKRRKEKKKKKQEYVITREIQKKNKTEKDHVKNVQKIMSIFP